MTIGGGAIVPSWPELLPELCGLVVDHLDAFSVLRLPGVCKSWAAACKEAPRRLLCGAPTLLASAAPDGDNNAGAAAGFALHDVSTGKSFHVDAAEGLRSRWWVGGNADWLVTTDAQCDAELLHPATGRRVRLPSFATIPGATLPGDLTLCVRPRVVGGSRSVYRLQQVALCRTPADPTAGYLAIASFGSLLAFAAAGDERWTALTNHPEGYICYADAIAHEGKVFAVSRRGDVYCWTMDAAGATKDPAVVRAPELQIDRWAERRFNLATSGGGRLLLVCTHGGDRRQLIDGKRVRAVKRIVSKTMRMIGAGQKPCRHARGVLLYELDDGGAWRRAPDVGGDRALFVGMSYPFCATVPRRGCSYDLKANCVYVADVSGYDAVVFDLDKGCAGGFEPLVHPVDGGSSQKPIWFRPTANLER